ncbi:hypothetical protein EXIGLDRAFT_637283 [Exidia glandulosa HHB12029]|uniref:chitin deacetylase n=1 Tax=Exidia glandulosa HHB12029 TaxID=1314781 RepID=A0A165PUN0_EXIGL|nr:hypothetical protein EXIGLDRAFT_637283 [Exidia glandulosa HHB12029]
MLPAAAALAVLAASAAAHAVIPDASPTVVARAAESVPVHPASTNPAAIPLESITQAHTSDPAEPYTTFTAGTVPTAVPGAPPLPDLKTLNFFAAPYPPLDKVPPTDSPEVQQWIKDVASSGVQIPTFAPTAPGDCAGNPSLISDTSRCWWTCGHCTRDDDIVACPDKLTWGLTFDDGPGLTSMNLVNYLGQQDLKATFFIIGSRGISRPDMVQSEYILGHQIGIHTWSHPRLTNLKNEEIIAELGWTKRVLKEILGVTPNTFRPPYGDIDDRVRAIAKAMGLTPVMWTTTPDKTRTFDTQDFEVGDGSVSSFQVIANFDSILDMAPSLDTGFIMLEHDLFAQTVDLAVGYTIPDGLAHQPKLALKSVIDCMHQPLQNAYIETSGNNGGSGGGSGGNSTTAASSSKSKTSTGGKTGSTGAASQSGNNGLVHRPISIGGLVGVSVVTIFLARQMRR